MCILNSYIVCWFHWIFIISIQTATFGKYIQRCVRKYFGASFWTKLSQPAERLPFYYKIVKLSKPLGKYWRLDGRHLTSLVLEKKPNSEQKTVFQFRFFFKFSFLQFPRVDQCLISSNLSTFIAVQFWKNKIFWYLEYSVIY